MEIKNTVKELCLHSVADTPMLTAWDGLISSFGFVGFGGYGVLGGS